MNHRPSQSRLTLSRSHAPTSRIGRPVIAGLRARSAICHLDFRAANAVGSLAPRSGERDWVRGGLKREGHLVPPLTRTRLLVESWALSPLRGARARAATVRPPHATQ